MSSKGKPERANPPCTGQPHVFADFVNGKVLQFGFREGVAGIERKCVYCDLTEDDILKHATPEHIETEA